MTHQENHQSRVQQASSSEHIAHARRSPWLGRLITLVVLVIWPLTLVGFFISSCSEDHGTADESLMRQLNMQPDRIGSYDFHGLLIPGTKEDAKRQGFTDCSANDAFFYCTRRNIGRLLGVEARGASLILDEMDNFVETRFSIQKRNPGTYSYRAIQIVFGPTFYDPDCLAAHHKDKRSYGWWRQLACRKNEGIDYFKYQLEADGWVIDQTGRGRVDAYYKHGVPLEIEIGVVNGVANIRPFPLKDVGLIVQAHANPAETAAEQQAREAFIRSMKP